VDSLSSKERYDFDVKRSIDMALLAKENSDYESTRFKHSKIPSSI